LESSDSIVVSRAASVYDLSVGDYSYEINNNGYVHVLRNDGYTITIDDDTGVKRFFDQFIADGTQLSFTVTGDATLAISYPGVGDGTIQTTPYYTVSGAGIAIDAGTTEATIELTNENYSLITLDPTKNQAIQVDISSVRINDVVPQLVVDDQIPKQYAYDYVTGSSSLTATTLKGELLTATLDNPLVGKQYSYSYKLTAVGPDTGTGGGGIVIDPGWEGGIETDNSQGTANAVISFSQVISATDLDVTVDEYVTGMTNGQAVWIYEPDIGVSSPLLKNIAFNYIVDFETESYVNIYLYDTEGVAAKANIMDFGRVDIDGIAFDSYDEFRSSDTYKNYTLRNWRETYQDGINSISVIGNFFLRLGSSTYTGKEVFTVKSWNIDTLTTSRPDVPVGPTPVIPLNQIAGAASTTINSDNTISGITAETYATRMYLKVSGSGIFSGYDLSTEIDFTSVSETNTDFVNIYLRNPDSLTDTVRLGLYLRGDNAGLYYVSNDLPYQTEVEVQAAYGDYIVRQYSDSALPSQGGNIIGNFIWRSSSSSGYAVGDFTVNEFGYAYTVANAAPPVIDLEHVKYASNDLHVNEDGSVTGSTATAGTTTTAYYSLPDTDNLPLLSAYPNVLIKADNSTGGYWNVYLEDPDETVYRLTWEPALEQFSVYIKTKGSFVDHSDYSMMTWDDVMASDYATMTLINWREGIISGNFLLRLKNVPDAEFDFTITDYTIETPME